LLKGHAAGPRWNQTGSGAGYLCLPEHPKWKNYVAGRHMYDDQGTLAGVEYQFYDHGQYHNSPFSTKNSGGPGTITNRPAPCVVCYVPKRSTVLMVPSDTECPKYWKPEYAGYLVSESRENYRSEYLCWDEAPEYLHGEVNRNHALVYPVEFYCGTLPCHKYPTGREIPCMVCSK